MAIQDTMGGLDGCDVVAIQVVDGDWKSKPGEWVCSWTSCFVGDGVDDDVVDFGEAAVGW